MIFNSMGTCVTYSFAMLIAIILILLIYMKWSLTYWKRKNIPHLKASFPFGNFENPITNKKPQAQYFKEFYKKLKNMGAKGGGIYAYSSPIFFPLDPEFNKNILVKDFQNFHARNFYSNEKHQPVSANLFTTDGDRWKSLRTKFTPTFTSAKMRLMFDLMVECTKSMEEYVAQRAARKTPIRLSDCTGRLTTDIIGSCAFGLKCNSFKNVKFKKLLETNVRGVTSFVKLSLCSALPELARFLRVPLFPKKEADIICNLIDETVERRKESNTNRNDFMQLVIELKNNGVIDMNELRGQCILFLLGGYETSATAMTFALFELARHQDVQEKVRGEIKEILSKHDGEMTYEAIKAMKYLEMVVCETLRMYPPLPILNRKCVQNYNFPNSNIAIEKGVNIIIPTIGLHYDPEYFPNPEEFDPERFSDEEKHKIVPYTYMPFGEGPRNCIAERFGKLQVRVGLATLLRKYRFKLNPDVKLPLQLETCLVLKPVGDILVDVETNEL